MERIVITKDGRAITQRDTQDWCESLLEYHEALRLLAALDTLAKYERDSQGRIKP